MLLLLLVVLIEALQETRSSSKEVHETRQNVRSAYELHAFANATIQERSVVFVKCGKKALLGRSLKHVRILRNTEKWILREPLVHLFVRRPSWDTLTRSPFYQQSQSKSVVPTKSTDLFRNFTSEKQ
jgi:hypothetical protein